MGKHPFEGNLILIAFNTAQFTGSVAVTKSAGWLGLITAFLAYYLGAAQLITTENSFFNLPVGILNSKKRTD